VKNERRRWNDVREVCYRAGERQGNLSGWAYLIGLQDSMSKKGSVMRDDNASL
jgi:hypothetical protein